MKYLGVMADLIVAGIIIESVKYYGQKKYEEGWNDGAEETRKIMSKEEENYR